MSKVFKSIWRASPSFVKKSAPVKFAMQNDPIAKATLGKVAAGEAAQKAMNAEAARLAGLGLGHKSNERAKDFETRQSQRVAAAESAGAIRVDNDYDLLGRGELTVKKKGASRTLLGTR